MLGWLDRIEYGEWIQREYEMRNPAVVQDLEECVHCGFCCTRRTCVPTPDELEPIAAFLGLTVPEMIQAYMVGDEQEGRYFLRWANKSQQQLTGHFLSARNTYDKGECILFKDGICTIHEIQPHEAQTTRCWDGNDVQTGRDEWPDGHLESLCPDMALEDEDFW